jgi:BlaI family penicillinase repressor
MSQTAARLVPSAGSPEQQIKGAAKQRSVLELAPLELACMNALWPMGEASVRDIRARMAAVRPRAYTTIMTIMDRLARKGIVARRRAGRAWLYRPNLSAEEARAHAIARVVEGFFGGSAAALAAHLGKPPSAAPASSVLQPLAALEVLPQPKEESKPKRESLPAPAEPLPEPGHAMDETLL